MWHWISEPAVKWAYSNHVCDRTRMLRCMALLSVRCMAVPHLLT